MSFNNTSSIHLITSSQFPEELFKLVVTNAALDDILGAHKDVYCEEESIENPFSAVGTYQVMDVALFEKYLEKWERTLSSYRPKGFFEQGHRKKIEQFVELVNSLVSAASAATDEETRVVTERLKIPVDAYKHSMKSVHGLSNLSGYEDCSTFASFNDGRTCPEPFQMQNVPLTCLLELYESQTDESRYTLSSYSLPYYNDYIIFNKTYAYDVELFKKVFPELQVVVHDGFPRLDLAEEMLWYQVNSNSSQDRRTVTKEAVKKIKGFFDIREDSSVEIQNIEPSFNLPVSSEQSDSSENVWHKTVDIPETTLQTEKLPCTPVSNQKIEILQSEKISSGPNTNEKLDTIWKERHVLQLPLCTMTSMHTENFMAALATDFGANSYESEHNFQKRMLMKEFLDQKCERRPGYKTKSSKLFELFKEFSKQKESFGLLDKLFNQTTFTIMMKQHSGFETKREKDGIYWIDLNVVQPSTELEEMTELKEMTKINDETNVPAKEAKAEQKPKKTPLRYEEFLKLRRGDGI